MRLILSLILLFATAAVTTAQQWPPSGSALQRWLNDQMDMISLRNKYDESLEEAAEELQSFLAELRKRRQAVQRRYVELKWKSMEAGHQWLQSDDELTDRTFRNLAMLEKAVSAKIDDLLAADPKVYQYFALNQFVNQNRSEIMKRYIRNLHMKLQP